MFRPRFPGLLVGRALPGRFRMQLARQPASPARLESSRAVRQGPSVIRVRRGSSVLLASAAHVHLVPISQVRTVPVASPANPARPRAQQEVIHAPRAELAPTRQNSRRQRALPAPEGCTRVQGSPPAVSTVWPASIPASQEGRSAPTVLLGPSHPSWVRACAACAARGPTSRRQGG